MATIYRKTAKGALEIEQRQQRLAPRFRSLLILVDGRRSDLELMGMLRSADAAAFEALVAGGYIEAIGQTIAAPTAPAPPRPAPPAPPAPPPAPSFEQRRQLAVRALLDQVGPAGDSVAVKLERATPDEFRARLEMAAQVVSSLRGPAAGQAYLQRFKTD